MCPRTRSLHHSSLRTVKVSAVNSTNFPFSPYIVQSVLTLSAVDDHIVPYGQSVIFEEALKQANVPVTLHPVGNSDHVFIGATKEEVAALDAATDEFLATIVG